jgi:hypothetical protein
MNAKNAKTAKKFFGSAAFCALCVPRHFGSGTVGTVYTFFSAA